MGVAAASHPRRTGVELTQVSGRFACAIRDDALEVVGTDGAVVPWLPVAQGDDLVAALGAVGRADAPRRLAAWAGELRATGAAHTRIGVVMPGGLRGALRVTAVVTDDDRCAVALRFDGPGDGASADDGGRAPDGVPDLRTALERLDEVCYELRQTPEGRWAATYVSPGWERLQGRPIPEDPVERSDTWLASIHPDDARRARRTALDGASRRAPVSHEYRIIRGDGEVRWVRDRVTGFAGPAGAARVTGVSLDITDQKLRELRLVGLLRALSEVLDDPAVTMPEPVRTRLRALLAGSPPGADAAPVDGAAMRFVVRVGEDGGASGVDMDGRLAALVGGVPEDLADVVHPDDRERVVTEFRAIVDGPGEGTQVFRLDADSGATWLRTVLLVTSRDPVTVTGYALDVTAFHGRPGASQPVVYEAHLGDDGEWRNEYLSPAVEDLLGEPVPDDARLRAAMNIERIHRDDLAAALAALADAVASGGPTLAEYRVVRRDGGMRRVRTTFARVGTNPLRVAGVMTDVSALAPAETWVTPASRAGDRLRFAESLEDVLVEFEVSGDAVRPRYASPSANALLGTPGLEPGAARAAAWFDAIDSRDRATAMADVRAAAGGDRPVRGALRVSSRDGARWVRTVLRGAPGRSLVTCVAVDITDLTEALTSEVAPGADQFARIVSSVPDGLWEVVVHDTETRASEFTFASHRVWDVLGLAPGETHRLGALLEDLIHPDDRALSRDQYARVLRRPDATVNEHRIIRPDGAVRWLRWVAHGRFTDHGVMHLVGTVADVTDEIAAAAAPHRAVALPALTARQREVLDHLVSGASTEEIARAMGIRPVTVANHVAALLRRLGVRSRLEAVAMALGQAPPGG